VVQVLRLLRLAGEKGRREPSLNGRRIDESRALRSRLFEP
jgi:hypothetical protein